jgi:hypothetical protein
MVKRTLLLFLAVSIAGAFPACKPNKAKTAAAAKAKLLADKRQRAIKNYEELVKKYPESEFATKAKERLRELGPSATPKK